MTGSATLNAALAAELATAEAVSRLAWGYASRADVAPVHWVTGADEGEDYCRECAEKAVEAARAAAPDGDPDEDIFCDGGWDARRASDTMCACGACGRLLGYALTSEGLAMEVAELEGQAEPVLPTPPIQSYAAFAMIDAAVEALRYKRDPKRVAIAIKAIDVACREIGITREMARVIAG